MKAAGQSHAVTGSKSEPATKNQAEIAQLKPLMKAGTFSDAVAKVAIEKVEQELTSLQLPPKPDERETARVIQMLPKVAEALRERIQSPNLGLKDPRSSVQARNALFGMFGMFGGKVPLRSARRRAALSGRSRRHQPGCLAGRL